MNLADASKLVGRLKSAFPRMTLDEEEMELVVKEVALLTDPLILNDAVDRIIRTSERFPTIAEIRAQYHSIVNAKRAATPALPDRPRETSVPEWVSVWYWHMHATWTDRQAANSDDPGPVARRRPVPLRNFPQYDEPGPDAYTWDDYNQIRDAWVAAGSPTIASVSEIFARATSVV